MSSDGHPAPGNMATAPEPSVPPSASGASVRAQRPRGALPPAEINRRQWRQLIIISVVAVGIYVTLRLLPTGTNLNHMDFRVQGKNSIEFCDPLNPQFIPVVAVHSPVSLTIKTDQAPAAGGVVSGVLTLATAGGKAIGPDDLLVVHDQKLHLLIADPSLRDYQHVHPTPGARPGDWAFSFQPRFGGTYRLFADFTPIATARSLYANADLEVSGAAADSAAADRTVGQLNGDAVMVDGYAFHLEATPRRLVARKPFDLRFTIAAPHSNRVPLQPIMGAYAHLVAFDAARSGFAHLHPAQADPLQAPDSEHPVLQFKLTIPTAGRYVIWSQVNVAGHQVFAPFWFNVVD